MKLKKISYFLILSLLGVVIYSCNTDDLAIQQEVQTQKYKGLNHIKTADLFKDKKFTTAFAKIPTKTKLTSLKTSKTIMEHEYGFTIEEFKPANVYETDSVVSYTLLITRPNQTAHSVENLVINTNKFTDSISAFLYKYESDVIINNFTNYVDNSIITPIVYNNIEYNPSATNKESPCIITAYRICENHSSPEMVPTCQAPIQYEITCGGGGGADGSSPLPTSSNTSTGGGVGGAIQTAPVYQMSPLELARKNFTMNDLTDEQFSWLTNPANDQAEAAIYAYLEYSNATTGELGYSPEKIAIVKNLINIRIWESTRINGNLLKPCMQSILNDIKKLQNGSVGQIIQKFAGNTPGFNWEVKDGVLSGGVVASTQTPSQYNTTSSTITTTFNTTAYPDASELSWARTIIHESVHAYLSVYFATNSPGFIGNYPNMVNDWGILQNWNAVHHEEFARSLVNEIANSLQEYGISKGYNLPRQFYDDMSWAGLQGTTLFQNLSPADQNRILNVIAIELTGIDLNSNSQIQKGRPAGC
ncbi:hypothetical protein EQG63_02875 [Flavobacterium amnicola]|uniref:Lipoprotein n=1 Tax=Flavobacterium amnicola TaxID=2506422 RepID=A0A4Q1K548_9FLAO|nr:hypothetical protein [Flavobacterium amnicola]RXR20898.1 hypothetical protein EQG63_02875 [Flavobacterium amnicola]